MARADRRSAKRAKQTPGIRASGGASAVEQTLFFSRIRKRAKWVFVFLALSFALGFVVFGVGAGGTGIGDILRGRSSGSSGPSVADATKKVNAHPRDPAALRELATALENDGRSEEAVPILVRYTRVRPKDDAALSELATLYLARAGRLRAEAQQAQIRAQAAAPDTAFLPPATTPLGQALGSLAITNAVASQSQTDFADKVNQMQAAYKQTEQVYQRIVVLRPEDAAAQLQLGDAALNAGDTTVGLDAYKRFLQLAPDDPQAPLVKQQIKQVEQSLKSSSSR